MSERSGERGLEREGERESLMKDRECRRDEISRERTGRRQQGLSRSSGADWYLTETKT